VKEDKIKNKRYKN